MEWPNRLEAAKETKAEGSREKADAEEKPDAEPHQELAHQKVCCCADDVDEDCIVEAGVVLLGVVVSGLLLRFFCRCNYLQEEFLGESEPGEMLEAGDGEDQQEGLVHLRLGDRDSQLFLRPGKHLEDNSLFRPIGIVRVIGKLFLDVLQPVISIM